VAAAVLLAGLLASAIATGQMGLHVAIGAFAFGLVCPRGGAAGAAAEEGAAVLGGAGRLLVPVFFLTTGLTVDLTGADGAALAAFGVLLVAATGAKFLGVAIAARLVGMGGRESAALGTLMNARGLTELVILEVGRSAGILDEATFTALVGVAIVTTVLTGPVFRRLHRPEATPGAEGPGADADDPASHPHGPAGRARPAAAPVAEGP
jgi:Kef-type K+ transport system membrane component KefB